MKRTILDLWRRAFGPKLRCKPGDVCIVVGQRTFHEPVLGSPFKVPYRMGLIVQVVRHDGLSWLLNEPVDHVYHLENGDLHLELTGISDELLQPLPRDPLPAEELQAEPPQHRAAPRPQHQEA